MASQVQGLAFLAVRIAVDFDEQEKFVQPMESIPIIERFQMFISLRFNVSVACWCSSMDMQPCWPSLMIVN